MYDIEYIYSTHLADIPSHISHFFAVELRIRSKVFSMRTSHHIFISNIIHNRILDLKSSNLMIIYIETTKWSTLQIQSLWDVRERQEGSCSPSIGSLPSICVFLGKSREALSCPVGRVMNPAASVPLSPASGVVALICSVSGECSFPAAPSCKLLGECSKLCSP